MGLLGTGTVSVPGGWAVALSVSVPGSTSGSIADSSCQREGEQQTQRWERAVGPPPSFRGLLELFHKEISTKGMEIARGSGRRSTRQGDLCWFFSF